MEDIKFRSLLVLLILNRDERFRNSYDLCKVLAWKFRIIECNQLSVFLADKKFTNEVLIHGVHHYIVTDEGKEYLKENEEWLTSELYSRYPSEREFIQNVLCSTSR